MITSDNRTLVITGAPMIGEGNVIDSMAFASILSRESVSCSTFYPEGPMVLVARWFHRRMSMSTGKTLSYALASEKMRSAFQVQMLRWELARSFRTVRSAHPRAACLLTSQNIMAEAAASTDSSFPVLTASSDVHGKYTVNTDPTAVQQRLHYFLWNREALDMYRNRLGLQNVSLTAPIDPLTAFKPVERNRLPFQEALVNPDLCYVKLSGSGSDPAAISRIILSLWKKNRVRCVIFPGTAETLRRIVRLTGKEVGFASSLDPSAFYGHCRNLLSHQQMILTYPSEQVKHIALLTSRSVFPSVVWLPPRGQHEVMNLAWAVDKGFSGKICVAAEFHKALKDCLSRAGIPLSAIELIDPEHLSRDHFSPSPRWEADTEEDTLGRHVKALAGLDTT